MSNLIHLPLGQLALDRRIAEAEDVLAELSRDASELKSQADDFQANGIRIPDGLNSAITEIEIKIIHKQSHLKALNDLRELSKSLKR